MNPHLKLALSDPVTDRQTRLVQSAKLRYPLALLPAIAFVTLSLNSLVYGAPIVNAGSSRNAWTGTPTVSLSGSYTGASGSTSILWSKISGPGTVTFAAAQSASTTATFSTSGYYELQMAVTDSTGSSADKLTVTIYDSTTSAPARKPFGYTAADLDQYFKDDLHIQYDRTGLDTSRFSPPPAPYTHPRILINPSDLPDLRARLLTTQVGQTEMATIRKALNDKLIGPTATYANEYNSLAAGNTVTTLTNTLVACLAYEAFRCTIDNDTAGGAKLGAALSTLCGDFTNKIIAANSTDWRTVNSEIIYHEILAYAYDFGYNYMTAAQQAVVRNMLATATAGQWCIGMDALPALDANRSNWIVNNTLYLLLDALAIEGETGYDANILPRVRAALERFYTMGVAQDGALYEGMGKGQINAQALIALAKRGKWLIASTAAKYHVSQFHLDCMEPWGYGFTWDELNGGNDKTSKYSDVPVLKYAFPNDPNIDFILRQDLGPGLNRFYGLRSINFGFIFESMDCLVRAIVALDFDTSKTWTQAAAGITAPLGRIYNDRGLIVARTGWDANAIRLMFQPRSNSGGHSVPDRNGFTLDALGRIWVPYLANESQDPSITSAVIRIDGQAASALPAAVVEYGDSPRLTYAVGDARIPFSYKAASASTGTLRTFTTNDNRFYPDLTQPWADLADSDLPEWQYSDHKLRYWTPYVPVQYAFRTAALIRGASPYCLIVDDVRKDSANHTYTWRMPLAPNLTMTSSGNEAVLTDTSNRQLRVRVLSASGSPTFSIQTIASSNVLDITTVAVDPAFKIMLFPSTITTPAPVTTWSGNTLTVAMSGGQTDLIDFASGSDGRTRIGVQGVVTSPWSNQDIGTPGASGSATQVSTSFTQTGAGADIWNTTDAFNFTCQPVTGDCTITAQVTSLENISETSKAGVMIRETLGASSAHASMYVTPERGISFQTRATTGGIASSVNTPGLVAPYWVRVKRTGNTFTASRSPDGVTWTTQGTRTVSMASNVYVGLLVCSVKSGIPCTADFQNVVVTNP